MPLQKGKSKKVISANIKELTKKKGVGKSRKKAISTLAKRRGISPAKAQRLQAVAIALGKSRRSRKRK
tara:strand:- start:16330 stop:16533 length:204 start_codon:yes stop_codon:yes gene_type:complete